MHGHKAEIGATWLQMAKMARTSGQFQIAQNAILHARSFNAPYYFIEKAKLLWSEGNHHQALLELQDELKKHEAILRNSNSNHGESEEVEIVEGSESAVTAKTLLLVGRWMQQGGQAHYKEVINQFDKVIKLIPKWEKGYFFLAKFYDTLFVSPLKDQQEKVHNAKQVVKEVKDKESETLGYLFKAIYNYGKSLEYGHTYIFHSLPRLLTLWFDFGASCQMTDKKSVKGSEFLKITKEFTRLIKTLPAYQWYTCYLQLISRICHPTKDVHELLQQILVKVLQTYPHQALWPLMAITKSLNTSRAHRAADVIAKAKQAKAPPELLDQGETFCSYLLELCNYPIPKNVASLSMQRDFPPLKRMFRKPLDLIIPLQSSLFGTLPPDGKPPKDPQSVFPSNRITIHSMKDEIEIMPSLQRPRKICMKVRDLYLFTCAGQ